MRSFRRRSSAGYEAGQASLAGDVRVSVFAGLAQKYGSGWWSVWSPTMSGRLFVPPALSLNILSTRLLSTQVRQCAPW
jgi:hypothetical protein